MGRVVSGFPADSAAENLPWVGLACRFVIFSQVHTVPSPLSLRTKELSWILLWWHVKRSTMLGHL